MKNKNIYKQKNTYLKWAMYITSLISIILIWWIVSAVIFKNNRLIPTPKEVTLSIGGLLKTQALWNAILFTLLKTILCFLLAFLLGLIFALISAKLVYFKLYLDPIMSIIRSFPTLAVTLLLLMWFNGDIVSIVIGFVITFPIIYTTIYDAIKRINKNLILMAKTFNVSKYNILVNVTLPQILPYLFSAILSGFTLTLKVVIAAEIVSLPRNSIGLNLVSARNSFDYTLMFAWVVISIILSFLCEHFIKYLRKVCLPWERNKEHKWN